MAGTDAFKVEGEVVEVLSERLFRVQLSNGHRLLGFIAAKNRKVVSQLAAGDKVKLQLSPYDLSEGRIIVETERKSRT
jgi:translation initiation factor IF-1